jgi:hypothetical protein
MPQSMKTGDQLKICIKGNEGQILDDDDDDEIARRNDETDRKTS